MSLALKQNLRDHKFEDDGEAEILLWWLTTQGTYFSRQRIAELVTRYDVSVVMGTMWKSNGRAAKVNPNRSVQVKIKKPRYTSAIQHHFITHMVTMAYVRDAQIPEAKSPGWLNLVRWRLNVCGSPVRNLLHVAFLTPRILRWLYDFFENLCVPGLCVASFQWRQAPCQSFSSSWLSNMVYKTSSGTGTSGAFSLSVCRSYLVQIKCTCQ